MPPFPGRARGDWLVQTLRALTFPRPRGSTIGPRHGWLVGVKGRDPGSQTGMVRPADFPVVMAIDRQRLQVNGYRLRDAKGLIGLAAC